MNTLYVVPAGSNPTTYAARSNALGCNGVGVGDPTGLVSAFPSVAVISTSTPPAIVPAIIADDTGQATLAAVQAAQSSCATAESAHTTNAATILTNIQSRQSQIQAWMTANPSGAVLTAAQTLTLAQMLNGLCKLALQQYSSSGQT